MSRLKTRLDRLEADRPTLGRLVIAFARDDGSAVEGMTTVAEATRKANADDRVFTVRLVRPEDRPDPELAS